MSQKWRDATLQYRRAEEEKARVMPREQQVQIQEDTWRLRVVQIAEVGRDLEQFLKSPEGLAALALLGAAKRHIIFGEERGDGCARVFFIDVAGLQRSDEPHGVWMAYTKEKLPEPKISSVTAINAVQAAVWYGGKKSNEVLAWLRGELDKIADAADSGEGI